MKFTKMHGCGNDYVYVNGFTEKIDNKSELSKKISDRHFGVGSDGIIFINPSEVADFEMEMYNSDGSRAEMCGNGIRCVGKYVYDKGMTDKEDISVVSFGKVKYLHFTIENGEVKFVRVNMGEPELIPEKVPVHMPDNKVNEKNEIVNEPIEVDGEEYRITCVSMGNPHAVVFMDDIRNLEIEKIGPKFENHTCFPKRTNTEFVHVLDEETVEMRVWERGAGETLACGTGACAVAVACILNGLTKREITVRLLGGDLKIKWDANENRIDMTGPATTVFEGEYNV